MEKRNVNLSHHTVTVSGFHYLDGYILPRFYIAEHTEELLALHEKEIQRLREERRIKAPILAQIKKYYEICDEEKELAVCIQRLSYQYDVSSFYLPGSSFRSKSSSWSRPERSRKAIT
jgi:hypothetical protein